MRPILLWPLLAACSAAFQFSPRQFAAAGAQGDVQQAPLAPMARAGALMQHANKGTTKAASEGMRYYTELSDEEIAQSESKELLLNLKSLEDQLVVRFSGWGESQEVRKAVLLGAHDLQLDIWATSQTRQWIDIKADQAQLAQLLEVIERDCPAAQYNVETVITDLPQAVFETLNEAYLDQAESNEWENQLASATDVRQLVTGGLFFKQYRNLESIYKWFDLLVETYPDLLTVEWIGQTYEGRDIKALRISGHKDSAPDEKIKTVVLTGGLHAREWISISTICYVLSSLLSDLDAGSKKAKMYLNNLDFLFLPVMNPDGYDYTWKTDRLWKKNRQETYHPRCFGIDIDHSFNFHYTASRESPCSEEYAGEGAFEALEAYSWDNYLNQTHHKHPIYAYIDLHSYAEEVLYPYAYSCTELPRDEENLLELAYGLSQAIRLNSSKIYGVLSACEDRGADLLPLMGAGSALDYMYHNKAYWAFVLKLRDTGSRGFTLPAAYILPTGNEIYSAVKYMCDFLLLPKE